MRQNDKILIQKKVDGLLSPTEEKRFETLVDSSSKARKFYRELLTIHHLLEKDAQESKPVDLSHEILREIKTAPRSTQQKNTGRRISPVFRQNVLAYAAILIIGMIVGGTLTFFGTYRGNEPDTEQISGTLASVPDEKSYDAKNDTEIKAAEFKSGKVILTTLAVHTGETIHCRILPGNNPLTNDQVTLLFTEGNFQQEEAEEGGLQYACTGSVVFQINRSAPENKSDPLQIDFYRKDACIKHFYFN